MSTTTTSHADAAPACAASVVLAAPDASSPSRNVAFEGSAALAVTVPATGSVQGPEQAATGSDTAHCNEKSDVATMNAVTTTCLLPLVPDIHSPPTLYAFAHSAYSLADNSVQR